MDEIFKPSHWTIFFDSLPCIIITHFSQKARKISEKTIYFKTLTNWEIWDLLNKRRISPEEESAGDAFSLSLGESGIEMAKYGERPEKT